MAKLNFVLIIYVIFGRSQGINSQKLPNHLDFVSTLLEIPRIDVLSLARNFTFLGVDSDEVKFFLYVPAAKGTEQPSAEYKFIPVGPEEVNLTKPTKIYTHGWLGNVEDEYIKQLAEIYVRRGDYNFIAVYWDEVAKKNYLEASSSCKDVGRHLGQFIYKAANGEKSLLMNVHLIGHSLGAQVSGFAGKKIKERGGAGVRVGRITALDAASPLFEFPIAMPAAARVASDDAVHVEGVHTNAGFLGFFSGFADVDFYINNGGPIQPGCLNPNIADSIACSHMRAHVFYGEAVRDFIDSNGTDSKWLAINCPNSVMHLSGMCEGNSAAIFGEESSANAKGSYFLITQSGYETLDTLSKQIKQLVQNTQPKFPYVPNIPFLPNFF